MNKNRSSLKFESYVVEEIEFNTNFEFSGEDKDIDFELESEYKFEEDNFILTLDMTIFPNSHENDYPFSMRIKMLGLFEVDSNLDANRKIQFAQQNAIAILFPYLRALISVYSSNANVGTVILPPINVVKYLENKGR